MTGWDFPVPSPDFYPAYLAADGFGQLVYELNHTGIFVGSRHPLDEILDFFHEVRTGLGSIVI